MNHLVCSSIRVVNDKGELCATLLGSEDGGFLALYDAKKDTPRIMGSSELSVENEINLGLTQSSTQIRPIRQ